MSRGALLGLLALVGLIVAAAAGAALYRSSGTSGSYTIRAATLQGGISTLDVIEYLGLTERQGYPLMVLRLQKTPDIMAALARGDADLGVIPAEMAAKLIESGVDVRIVAVDMLQNQAVLVKDPNITSIRDLKGKLVGAIVASGTYKIFKAYARIVYGISVVEGEKPRPDVITVVNIPPGSILDALGEGRVAAVVVWEPLVSIGLSRGYKILTTFQDLWSKANVSGKPVMLVWVARGEFVEDHGDALEAFLRARCEAARIWKTNESLTLEALGEIYKLPTPILERLYDRTVIVEGGLTSSLVESIRSEWWLAWRGGYLTADPSGIGEEVFYTPRAGPTS